MWNGPMTLLNYQWFQVSKPTRPSLQYKAGMKTNDDRYVSLKKPQRIIFKGNV